MNFDEIDFRLKCMKKQEIIVFIEIREHYQINSENRKSLIIICQGRQLDRMELLSN